MSRYVLVRFDPVELDRLISACQWAADSLAGGMGRPREAVAHATMRDRLRMLATEHEACVDDPRPGHSEAMTVADAAALLDRHPATIRRMCDDGRLRAQRVGRRVWAIDPSSIEELTA